MMKKIALWLSCLLLALITFDQLHSGTVTVENVQLENTLAGYKGLPVALPFNLADDPPVLTKPREYIFTIPFHSSWLDDLSPIFMQADDYVTALSIDKHLVFSDPAIHRNNIPIGHVEQEIRVTVQDWGGTAKLSLIRNPVFSSQQTFLLAALALYLVFTGLGAVSGFAYAYEAALVTLFFYSTLPSNYWLNHEWLTFMATGPAIFMLALASRHWAPVLPIHHRIDAALQRIAAIPGHWWAWGLGALCLVTTSILAHVAFGLVPHVADTHAQYVMAKIFAEGKLTDTSHPLKQFFDFQFIIDDGKYYGQYFPGHPALLALGLLAHVPWIVNPLFGALAVVMSYFLGREVAGKNAGMLAAFLMLISPQLQFISAEYMSHDTCMFFLTAFVYCYIRLLNTNRRVYAVLTGICIGCAFVIRAQSAFPFGLAIALHAAFSLVKKPRLDWKHPLIMAACFAPFALFLLYYNLQTTGELWLTPYEKFQPYQAQMLQQFASFDRWRSIGGDITRAFSQVLSLHIDLMGWPCSPFLFILILYLLRKPPRHCHVLMACFIASFLGLVFINPFGNNVIPGRYLYECTGILLVLAAAGMCRLAHFVRSPASLALTLAALMIWSWPYCVRDDYELYAYNFYEGNQVLYHSILAETDKPALVFMKGYGQYRFISFNNPPRDSDPIIFARDLGGQNQKLMDYYPNRHVYLVDGWFIQKLR